MGTPRPGAATRYIYARRRLAGLATRSLLASRFAAPVHPRRVVRLIPAGPEHSPRQSSGWESNWVSRCRGLGEICARQTCRRKGQTAAHGQITERRYSVPRFRFSSAGESGRVPVAGNPPGIASNSYRLREAKFSACVKKWRRLAGSAFDHLPKLRMEPV